MDGFILLYDYFGVCIDVYVDNLLKVIYIIEIFLMKNKWGIYEIFCWIVLIFSDEVFLGDLIFFFVMNISNLVFNLFIIFLMIFVIFVYFLILFIILI